MIEFNNYENSNVKKCLLDWTSMSFVRRDFRQLVERLRRYYRRQIYRYKSPVRKTKTAVDQ